MLSCMTSKKFQNWLLEAARVYFFIVERWVNMVMKAIGIVMRNFIASTTIVTITKKRICLEKSVVVVTLYPPRKPFDT